jgi:hypothetical protein
VRTSFQLLQEFVNKRHIAPLSTQVVTKNSAQSVAAMEESHPCQLHKNIACALDRASYYDLGYVGSMTPEENIPVQNGKFVGHTGIRTKSASTESIRPTIASASEGYYSKHRVTPYWLLSNSLDSFQDDEATLLTAAKCISLLGIVRGGECYVGTAFFVGPNVVLTAGHNTHGPETRGHESLTLSFPADSGPIDTNLFFNSDELFKIECTVIDTLWGTDVNPPRSWDISILKSGLRCPTYLELSTEKIPAGELAVVAGFPGVIDTDFVQGHQPLTKPTKENMEFASALLPAATLTFSKGTVQTEGDMVTYQLATCPGMSGSPLLYNGKVHGNQPDHHQLMILGVHVGQDNEGVLPQAVSFTSKRIQEFLQKNKILEWSGK